MKKFWLLIIVLTSLSIAVYGQSIDTIDSFSDGNFTANPEWTVVDGNWSVVNGLSNPFNSNNPFGLQCSGSGRLYTPYTPQTVRGTWQFDFYAAGGGNIDFAIISDGTAIDVYHAIRFFVTSAVRQIGLLYNGEVTPICVSPEDFIEFDTFYHVVITRTLVDEWYMTIQGGVYTDTIAPGIQGQIATPVDPAYFVFSANPGDILCNFTYTSVELLAVELSSFSAVILDNAIKLNWRTETEVSNYGFEVQRSISNVQSQDWDVLGFVPGNGNSNSPKDYTFIDNNVAGGKYFYRLKQIDTDGKFEYLKVIEVYAGNIVDGFILEQNYPNPFNPSTTIKFALAETQNAELKIFDILGNEVETLFNGIADGGKVYEAEFNATRLSSGIYFYQLTTENKVENRKMLLLK